MSEFVIGESLYHDGKLVEVAICCLDAPEPPEYHLYETHLSEPADVVNLIKKGHQVIAAWGPKGGIPVEVVTLADGTESIEVVQQGQPEGHRSLADLPQIES